MGAGVFFQWYESVDDRPNVHSAHSLIMIRSCSGVEYYEGRIIRV